MPDRREAPPTHFTCALCGQTYAKDWSDEEALAEAEANFGQVAPDDLEVVCDDCYNRIMRR